MAGPTFENITISDDQIQETGDQLITRRGLTQSHRGVRGKVHNLPYGDKRYLDEGKW